MRIKYYLLLFSLTIILLVTGCANKNLKVTNLSQLEGGRVFAVPTGTVADQFVLKKFPDAKIKYFNTVLDCALAVKGDKADAAVYDKPILKNIAAKNDGLTVLNKVLVDDQYGFAVQMENKALKNAIDEVLAEIKSNGIYDDMMKRWFPEKGNPAAMPQIELKGEKGVLRFGTAAVTEPMSFVDASQKVVGFDIEFASYVAQKLGKRLEIMDMEFGAMLPALIAGKVDMIGAGLSITEERAKSVLFSESYYPSGIAALVKDAPEGANSAEPSDKMRTAADIANKKIGVLLGSIHDSYATKTYPKASIFEYQNVSDMLMALNTGKVDAAFDDHIALIEVLKKNPDIDILEKNLFSVDIAAGFNETNDELREQFNAFLKEIKSNGVYDEIVSRWMDKGDTDMPEIVGTNKNGKLKVGIVGDMGMPCSMVQNGEYVGFDIELAKRFAAYLGKEFVPVDMPFGSLIASISTNKIDMIAAEMMITEERDKQIDFSDPYYNSGVSVIARKEDIAQQEQVMLSTLDDLADKRIGVLLGSVHDAYATKKFPDAEVMEYQNVSDLLIALSSDKVDVAIMGNCTLPEIFMANPGLAVFQENMYANDLAAGFNKNNDALRDQFNTFLAELKTDGTYDDMINRWMKRQSDVMPVIKSSGQNGELRVGVVYDLGMPFTILKGDELCGFDIELGERFAAWLGKTYVPVDLPFVSLIASIATNKIDMITASMMATEERARQIDFSDAYYAAGATVITKIENIAITEKEKIAKLDDIADKRVGIFSGTVFDGFLSNKYPNAKIFRYDGTADMMISLKTDKVDAVVLDAITAGLILKRNPDLGLLTDDVLSMDLGVGFNKKNPALRKEFNAFLKEIRKNGTYDEMQDRWFTRNAEEAVMPEIANHSDGKKLTVAVSVDDLPYVAYMNGKYAGFDIEMIERFADHGNYNLEFIQVEFPALIAALAAGKADMITDGICISKERAKQIDFSDTYAKFRSSVIVAKRNMVGYSEKDTQPVKKSFFKSVSESFYNNIILENRYLLILDGLKITIIISILSAIFGTIIGGLICFMKMSKNKFSKGFAGIYISLVRGTPVLVLLMIIFYVVFASVNINPVLVAIIAFGINFGAYVSEMFRTSIDSIDKGQREAGIAAGFTPVQTFINIIMPQAIRQVLPVYKGEFISLVKMTSIVGYIAVQDLTKASDIIRSRTFDAFFPLIMAAVIYILIAWVLTGALSYIEISVDPKRKRNLKKEEVSL